MKGCYKHIKQNPKELREQSLTKHNEPEIEAQEVL